MAKHRDWASRRTEVAAWRESGGSAAGFARERGYSVQSLKRWIARVDAEDGARAPRLVKLQVVPRLAPSIVIEVAAHGARVVVPVGFDAAHLHAVIAALGPGAAS
jgi:hypothetical protein